LDRGLTELEGTHGVIHSELEGGVNIFAGRDAFFKVHDSLIDEGHEESVGDESGDVLGDSHLC